MAEQGIPMSVRRLIAEADLALLNVSEFCVVHGISRWSFYSIRKRFDSDGEAGLELRSRAPNKVPNKTPFEVEDMIVKKRKELDNDGLDAGPETIRWHLQQGWDSDGPVPSVATIWRILRARGFIVPDPSKAPNKKCKRFEADRANQVWQIDGTDHDLADGKTVKIINIIDDGSRLVPASQAHRVESFDAVWSTACAGATAVGWPERFLSDNGKANIKLEGPLAEIGVVTGHSRPHHPQTCGKVERFHQTQAKWLAKQPAVRTLDELQGLLDEFRAIYNNERPHRAIGRKTPAQRWDEMAKSGPADQPLNIDATKITRTTVASNGIVPSGLYAISVGNRYAGKQATTIITGTSAWVFIGTKLIRKLTVDPTKRVQPLHQRRGRPQRSAT